MKTNWMRITAYCFILTVGVLVVPDTFCQQTIRRIGDKEIKTGLWNGQQIEYVEREIAVKLKPNARRTQADSTISYLGARVKNEFDNIGWGFIELIGSGDIMATIQQLQQKQFVEAVEPVFVTNTSLET